MIRFNDADEFVDELRKSRAAVVGNIVRVTTERRTIGAHGIVQLTLVATAEVYRPDGTTIYVVRLDERQGDLWGLPRDAEVGEKATRAMKELIAGLSTGFEVRAGVAEPDAEAAS